MVSYSARVLIVPAKSRTALRAEAKDLIAVTMADTSLPCTAVNTVDAVDAFFMGLPFFCLVTPCTIQISKNTTKLYDNIIHPMAWSVNTLVDIFHGVSRLANTNLMACLVVMLATEEWCFYG